MQLVHDESTGLWKCSACGGLVTDFETYYRYCPYCSAKMDLRDSQTNENTCTACGEIIPEGRQVCRACEDAATTKSVERGTGK